MSPEEVTQFKLEWDKNYGIARRKGWTVVVNGLTLVELEPNPIKALWQAWRWHRRIVKDLRYEASQQMHIGTTTDVLGRPLSE